MKELAPNVIMIPPKEETPQDQEHKRSLRVAAYCRVSTDNDEQLSSYENQRAYSKSHTTTFSIHNEHLKELISFTVYAFYYGVFKDNPEAYFMCSLHKITAA